MQLTKHLFSSINKGMVETFSGLASFFLFHLASHPKSKLNRKLPSKKIKRIQILPRVNIEAKNRVFHIHHWVIFTPLYFLAHHVEKGLLQSDITSLVNGFLLGGIIQGLLYKDRFRFIHRVEEYNTKVKKSSYNLSFLRKLI